MVPRYFREHFRSDWWTLPELLAAIAKIPKLAATTPTGWGCQSGSGGARIRGLLRSVCRPGRRFRRCVRNGRGGGWLRGSRGRGGGRGERGFFAAESLWRGWPCCETFLLSARVLQVLPDALPNSWHLNSCIAATARLRRLTRDWVLAKGGHLRNFCEGGGTVKEASNRPTQKLALAAQALLPGGRYEAGPEDRPNAGTKGGPESGQFGDAYGDALRYDFEFGPADQLRVYSYWDVGAVDMFGLENGSGLEAQQIFHGETSELQVDAEQTREPAGFRPKFFGNSGYGLLHGWNDGGHGSALNQKFGEVDIANVELRNVVLQSVQNIFLELGFAFGSKKRIGFTNGQNRKHGVANASDGHAGGWLALVRALGQTIDS